MIRKKKGSQERVAPPRTQPGTLPHSPAWSASLAALLVLASLAACDDSKEGLADAKRSQDDIKSALGVGSEVSFRTSTGSNEKILTVIVHLDATPPGDVATIKENVTGIVTRDFRSHVDSVVVSF